MNQDQPENCSRCAASLERGYSLRYRGEELVEALCFRCNDADNISRYESTKVLTTPIIMMAMAANSWRERDVDGRIAFFGSRDLMGDAWDSYQHILQEAKALERDVWFGGLRQMLRESTARGFRMPVGSGEALAYVMSGRAMLTFELGDAFVSLIADESSEESTMGVQGVRATEAQAVGLIAACRGAFLLGGKFEQDDKVGFGL